MRWVEGNGSAAFGARKAAWALAYATVDSLSAEALTAAQSRLRGAPLFGATSFRGVFCPRGFVPGLHMLVADEGDGVSALPSLFGAHGATARSRAREAAAGLKSQLGDRLHALLLHATPGFEERVLEGIDDAFDGHPPPVWGGSAADDDLSGQWRVFLGDRIEREGALLVGFASDAPMHGAFLGGYVPGANKGKITRARGRVVYEIDGKPAAHVYDRWTNGAISHRLIGGGTVLAETSLYPLGRVMDPVFGVTRHLLAHPHAVLAEEKALSFFTELHDGEDVVQMFTTEGALVERVERVVTRAVQKAGKAPRLRAGVLIYCGGCVGAIATQTNEVAALYGRSVGNVPFIGAATFGEQGSLGGGQRMNRHGNLMCDTLLFE